MAYKSQGVPIIDHVVKNYDSLPKSTFNEDEVVIVAVFHDSDEGWGNHSFSGAAIDKDGKVYYAFSSGCSCSGYCGLDHKPDFKLLESDSKSFSLEKLNPDDLDFAAMSNSFSDYE